MQRYHTEKHYHPSQMRHAYCYAYLQIHLKIYDDLEALLSFIKTENSSGPVALQSE